MHTLKQAKEVALTDPVAFVADLQAGRIARSPTPCSVGSALTTLTMMTTTTTMAMTARGESVTSGRHG